VQFYAQSVDSKWTFVSPQLRREVIHSLLITSSQERIVAHLSPRRSMPVSQNSLKPKDWANDRRPSFLSRFPAVSTGRTGRRKQKLDRGEGRKGTVASRPPMTADVAEPIESLQYSPNKSEVPSFRPTANKRNMGDLPRMSGGNPSGCLST
jgi:hypothetical protein